MFYNFDPFTMKFYLPILFICLVFAFEATAQCLQKNYSFQTQSSIDSFPIKNPGCSHILGSVSISGFNISNLNAFKNITQIDSSLSIEFSNYFQDTIIIIIFPTQTPLLKNLNGFNSLKQVGGNLTIRGNGKLETLLGLESLEIIGGSLELINNSISDLAPLSNLTNIGKSITISSNPNLKSISGLHFSESIDSSLSIVYNDALEDVSSLRPIKSIKKDLLFGCPKFKNLDILKNLNSIGNDCIVTSAINLENIEGLSALKLINGKFILASALKIKNLHGLDSIKSVGKSFSLINCFALSNLSSLDSIKSIGDALVIEGCTSLSNLKGLGALQNLGSLVLSGNSLKNIQGLDKLVKIPNYISVFEDSTLENVNGLEKIVTTKGLNISGNIKLKNLQGLNALKNIDGFFEVSNNPSFVNFQGLNNVTSTGGIVVTNNASLESFEGLNALKQNQFDFDIESNPSLISFKALNGLQTIDGNVRISNNAALTELTGLGNIKASSIFNLFINNNKSLSACNTKSICDYLSLKNYNPLIFNNAKGCDSKIEVESACKSIYLSTTETFNPPISLSPNPTSERILVNNISEKSAYSITNIQGQVLQTGTVNVDEQINVSNLPQGLYFLKVQTQVAKFVKE